jgi:hypothetical protein
VTTSDLSPRAEVLSHLGGDGWALLKAGKTWVQLYRWSGKTRVEVHVTFDRSGRVYAWSEWHNTRVSYPDQDTGRRGRLMERLSHE